MIKEFASFHNHSHFSVMDGLSLPEDMIKAAKQKGLKSIAITDHGHAHCHADFYLFGKKHGVRTVFGVEAYVIHDLGEWHKLKDSMGGEVADVAEVDTNSRSDSAVIQMPLARKLSRKGHLVLLAANQKGLSNLYQLTYLAYKDGFYSKPRMDKNMLKMYSEGLIATSACMGGVISNKCWDMKNGHGTFEDIVNEAKEFEEIFGKGRFFLELQFNESDSQRFINDMLVRVHKITGIPLTVASDAHYVKQEEWKAQELLYMLRSNKTFQTRGPDWSFEVKQLYIKSAEEMWHAFEIFGGQLEPKIAIEAFQNTLLIDSLIENFEPDTHKRLPSLPYDDAFMEMMQRAITGLKNHGLAKDERYKSRLLHELKIIKEKGFSNYFLITQRIIEEAKKEMLVGEGRGSSGGSLVCYCLGITDIDPIEHDLMFERFMDPARTEEPDIDVDFEDTEEAKDMLRRMFGEQNVACLSSYGTFQIKGLLKDVGRVLDLPNKIINDANKNIEKELKVLYHDSDKSTLTIRLDDVKRVSKTFNKLVDDYPRVGEYLETLYGKIRHASRHAAGVIIGDNLPAETALWTQKDPETGKHIVQASFTEGIVNKNVSAMGFTKFDILSIATLKVIHYALRLINKRTGTPMEELRESIRSKNMKLDDPKVMKHVFWDGNFAGVFQFSEKGIRRLAMKVKPDTFADVSAIASIYRPGPLKGGFDKLYIHNKHHPEDLVFDHPLLENILMKTRGCIVFQEQLMQICNVLGKMNWKDVNRVRKVLLKKDKSKSEEFVKAESDELTAKFINGCAENGFEKEKAEKLWKDLLAFGGYGFNKAHSDAYATLTMKCAYLATYFPMEWYAAVLTKGQSGELQQYVGDIKRAGVSILPVDINASTGDHLIGDNALRLSLRSVKGVGQSAIDKIVSHQPYKDFPEFITRSGVGKTAIEPLIMAGAFDCLYSNMKDLDINYSIYSEIPDYKRKHAKPGRPSWTDFVKMFDGTNQFEDYELHQKVQFENELFDFSLRGTPFEILDREKKIEKYLEEALSIPTDYYYGIDLDDALNSSSEVVILPVLIKRIFEKPQRNGQLFAFLTFETMEGKEFDCPCFATIWKNIRDTTKKGNVYMGWFNRKFGEDSTNLLVGRPGFAHSYASSQKYMFNVDSITL